MQVRQQIKTFIVNNFFFGKEGNLKDSDSFLDTGVIDSTGVLELIAYLDEEFGLKVADEELVPENLDSIDNVTAFVERKLAGAEGNQPVAASAQPVI